MGQHLHLYATKTLTRDDVQEWCKYRANDLFETPNEVAQKVESKMRTLWREGRNDHFEDGPGINAFKSDLFVWKPTLCTLAILAAVQSQCGVDSGIAHWLNTHLGFLIWGDNDGI